MLSHLLLAASGGAIGASCRYLTNLAALRLIGPNFPWGTLTVNVLGSFIMGVFIEFLARRAGATPNELRTFFATGFLGGFTTFSAFSLDFASMWERGDQSIALVYMLVSVIVSIVALFGGLALVRAVM